MILLIPSHLRRDHGNYSDLQEMRVVNDIIKIETRSSPQLPEKLPAHNVGSSSTCGNLDMAVNVTVKGTKANVWDSVVAQSCGSGPAQGIKEYRHLLA